jgi:hypothetical protein
MLGSWHDRDLQRYATIGETRSILAKQKRSAGRLAPILLTSRRNLAFGHLRFSGKQRRAFIRNRKYENTH